MREEAAVLSGSPSLWGVFSVHRMLGALSKVGTPGRNSYSSQRLAHVASITGQEGPEAETRRASEVTKAVSIASARAI